jgi:hypothetical protein
MKRAIHISHEDGDIEVTEDELATITDAELKWLGILREELYLVFAEGQRLMAEREIKESDRVRPLAGQALDDQWFVVLVQYSELMSDPLMQGRVTKKQKKYAN